MNIIKTEFVPVYVNGREIVTEKVYCSEFYKDEVTGILKRNFVMRCADCTIFQTKGSAGCKSVGYCQFSMNYDKASKEMSSEQRLRNAQILKEGYNNPRG